MEANSYINNANVLLDIVSKQLLNVSISPVQMYMLGKSLSENDAEWMFLTDYKEEQVKADLIQYLSLDLPERRSKCGENYIVYFDATEAITDSRCNRLTGKEVRIVWVFVASQVKYAYEIISQVFMRALTDKLTDLLQMESVIEKIISYDVQMLTNKGKEELLQNKIIGQYCSKLLDEEWLVNKYVNYALRTEGLPGPEKFLQLSAMRYETRESATGLYFGNKEKTKLKLEFCDEMIRSGVLDFKPENYRVVRKLMELAGKEHGLMIDTTEVNMMKVCGVLETKHQDIPECFVKIEGYLRWSLNVRNEKVFEYSNGIYSLQKVKADSEIEEKFNELEKFLNQRKWLEKQQVNSILECLKGIKEAASHGTSVVFLDKALTSRVDTLAGHNKAYKIVEMGLAEAAEISGVTSIDGAVMADFAGRCIAIGAILDGKSIQPGNAGRGARYNSVTNYVRCIAEENIEAKCFAAIFSEDKTIDFVCIDKDNTLDKIKII